ncbi:MAG: 3-hydroxyacyl-ACP dehydratase FabZ, partial [Candidatus Omnitrophica bacterium]|nr:3-hydroxyacyl-ACP dehydratase FabZ [Candidatus Omnitrophota bacterium]
MLDIEAIQKVLPQRIPFLMIDRVIELEPGKKVIAIKNVTINEKFFAGHFPQAPIMPGVLIIEAMAQSAIMLFCDGQESAAQNQKTYYLSSVKVRFTSPVVPGDQLKLTVEPVKVVSNAAIVNALAEVGNKEVAKGELSFSVK